jgi:hypothetical protein
LLPWARKFYFGWLAIFDHAIFHVLNKFIMLLRLDPLGKEEDSLLLLGFIPDVLFGLLGFESKYGILIDSG